MDSRNDNRFGIHRPVEPGRLPPSRRTLALFLLAMFAKGQVKTLYDMEKPQGCASFALSHSACAIVSSAC